MKNFFKLFGIIALVAVIGFLMVGCETETDTDTDDGNGGLLNGVWNRGDIVVTFNGSNGVFTEVNSDSSWQSFLDNNIIRIGDRKFRNITYKNNLTWKGQELGYVIGTDDTGWKNTTITMHSGDNTISVDTVDAGASTYTRQ
jgi:hypothetical protein